MLSVWLLFFFVSVLVSFWLLLRSFLFFLEGDVEGALQFHFTMFRHVFLFHLFYFGNVLHASGFVFFIISRKFPAISSNIACLPFFIYFLSQNPVSHILDFLIISFISHNISLILPVSLSYCTSFWEISSDISSSLLIFFFSYVWSAF